jgi:glutathione S-transferase
MKLLYSPRSPYARKVRVALREKGLQGQVQEVVVDPQDNDADLHALNPLGKVPALETEQGAFYDSPVVCEYLDSLSPRAVLVPVDPAKRLEVLRLQALADGIMDAAVSMVVERKRPESQRSPHWMQRWTAAIERSVSVLAGRPLPTQFDLGAIATACALDYLSFRCPEIGWAEREPALLTWAQPHFLRPSMQDTRPVWS